MEDLPGIDDWKSLSTVELEREYSPSSCVESIDALLDDYAQKSRESESRTDLMKNLRYGDGSDELLDFFPADSDNPPLQIYIHGGYWQQLTKEDSTFAGADFVANGVAHAAIDYTLAPDASISEMISQCRNSIVWLYRNAEELGFDPSRIFLSGSSAGAHLACMMLLVPWEEQGLPADLIKGVTLMSGVYDLRPLCGTYVNEPLGLDESEAFELSPLFKNYRGGPPAIICWGEFETDEFKRQSRAFEQAWKKAGNSSEMFEVAGCNHFDIVHTLADPASPLGSRVYSQIQA